MISKAIKLLCRRWGIRDIETGGYNAKANGIIERNHRFLLAALSILFDRRSPNWDVYIDPALFCYRVSIADSTGFSPYFLEHGEQPNLPASLNMPLEYQSNSNYIERTALRLHEAWEAARKLQFETSRRNHLRFTQHAVSFKSGDEVDIWMRANSEKYMTVGDKRLTVPKAFRNSWVGPHAILSKLDDNHYVVSYKGKEIKHNVNRLRLRVHWDNINRDTSVWHDKRHADILYDKRQPKRASKSTLPATSEVESVPELAPIDTLSISVGQHVIWTIPPEQISPFFGSLPFGVGIIEDSTDPNKIVCHHLGNSTFDLNGLFHPMWYQKSDDKCYFFPRFINKTHPKRTSANDFLSDTTLSREDKAERLKRIPEANIKSSQIIFSSHNIWDSKFHLSSSAKDSLFANPYVFETWGRSQMLRDKDINKRLKRKR